MHFLFFLHFITPQMVNAALHNITTVYVTSLTYEKDTFDLKSFLLKTKIQNNHLGYYNCQNAQQKHNPPSNLG